jgi:dTDP-glucose 4,6-dehydratase
MPKVLLTGGAGFAGVHLVEALVKAGWSVVVLDSLTYASRLDRLAELDVQFICHDLALPLPVEKFGEVNCIIHNAAESHVVRSIESPRSFVEANLIGTMNVLEAARKLAPERFIYISTDEVFGPSERPCEVDEPLKPTSPYSATKAGGEHLAYSYRKSYSVPVIISRTCNMFGPYQHEEKFVPLAIRRMLSGGVVPIHTTKEGAIGKRQWIHVGRQAASVAYLASSGVVGETYHISYCSEIKTNMEMAQGIAEILHVVPNFELVPADRPSYDEGYNLEPSLLDCGGKPVDFSSELRSTVSWYANRFSR